MIFEATSSFETGVEMEERILIWKIKNFPVVLQHDSMINSQRIEFYAGEAIGVASKWRASLKSKEANGKRWAGIFVSIMERPALQSEFLFAKCTFKLSDSQGVVKGNSSTQVRDMLSGSSGRGFAEFVDIDTIGKSAEEHFTIRISFKLYSPSNIAAKSVNKLVEEFKEASDVKFRKDLDHLRFDTRTYITIISSDKILTKVERKVIAARSPVFKAMLESDMAENNNGVITVPDVRYRTLIILIHFLCAGKLRRDWKNGEILVELTYAAAKYQLVELLTFLDSVLGRVCELDNVVALISLANKLSLKTAEQDLLRFVRMKGSRTTDDFLQALNNAFDMPPYTVPVLNAEESDSDTDEEDKDKASETRPGEDPDSSQTIEKMDDETTKEKPSK